MDGTAFEIDGVEEGGPCGVCVERDGRREIEMSGRELTAAGMSASEDNTMKDVQYVVNEVGEKTAVQISLHQFEAYLEFLEDQHLARVARESKDEETIPWEDIKAEMIAEGILDA